MLIITRKLGERIFINGDEIKIMVTGMSYDSVKLGIDAPKEIPVNRKEWSYHPRKLSDTD